MKMQEIQNAYFTIIGVMKSETYCERQRMSRNNLLLPSDLESLIRNIVLSYGLFLSTLTITTRYHSFALPEELFVAINILSRDNSIIILQKR